MADDLLQGVLLSRKETKTLKQLKDMGNVKVPVQKKDINYYVVALEEFLQEEAVTFYLDTANGDDANSGLSRSKPMKTVAAVVALARSLAGGDYFVSKYRLTVLGEGETISFYGATHTNAVLFDAYDFRSDPYVESSDFLPFQVITSEDRATSLIFANTLKITGDALFIGCNGSVTVTTGSSFSVSGNIYVKAKNLTLTSAGRIGGGADTIIDVSGTLEMTSGGEISCGGDIVVNAKNITLRSCSLSNGGSRYFSALKDLTVEYMSYGLGASSGITDIEAGNNILIRYVSGSGVSVGITYPFNMRAGNDITIHTATGLSDSRENNIVAGGTVRIASTTMPYGANITAKNISDVIDEDISGDIVMGLDVEDPENLKTTTLVAKDTIEVTGLVLKFGIEAAKFICHRLNVAGFINATGSLFIDTDELIINNNLSNISDTSLNLYVNAKKATFGGGGSIRVDSPRTEGYDEVYIDIANAPTQGYIYLDGRLNSLVKIDEIKGSFACYLNAQTAVLTQSNRRLLEMSKAYQSYDAVIRVRHRQGLGSPESLVADLKAALESTEVRTIYLVETVFLNEDIVLGCDKILYGEVLSFSGVMTGAFTVKFFNHLLANSGTFSCAEVYSRTVGGNPTIGGTCNFYYERILGGTATVGETASYSYMAWETETYAVADEETITGGAALGTDLRVLNAPVIRQPVFNNTEATISKGTPVAFAGTSGERVTIAKLISSTTITEQVNVGIVDADILANMEGYAVRSGEITMDTSAWEEGDTLYASTTAGVLSTSRPAKGYGLIPVGIVIKKDGVDAGKVLVGPYPVPSIRQLPDVNLVDPLPNQALCIGADGLVENRFIKFIANYNVTETAVIDEEFEKGSIIVCYRGYAYAEYLPLIRRIAKTSHPDPVTYIYVFGAVHDGKVVEITCDPVDGWSVLETPVGGNYQLKGSWSNSESYVMNDFCTLGDNLYICKSAYTSDPESDNPSIDTDHWELFFSGSRRTYQLKVPGTGENISWAPTVAPEEFTVLGNITSDMTSLVITLSAPPDSFYCYEYSFRFTTPLVLGITTFSILDHNGTAVNWLWPAPVLMGGKTYEVSVVDGLAVIGASV